MKKTPNSKSPAVRETASPAPSNPTRVVGFKRLSEEEYSALGSIQSPIVVDDLVIDSARLQAARLHRDTDDDKLRERAISALKEMKPDGVVQGMLAVQIIGVHNAVIEFLSRATAPAQTSDEIDRNVLRVTRLGRLLSEQVEMLQKLQGRHVQQKIIVEHLELRDQAK